MFIRSALTLAIQNVALDPKKKKKNCVNFFYSDIFSMQIFYCDLIEFSDMLRKDSAFSKTSVKYAENNNRLGGDSCVGCIPYDTVVNIYL